LDRRHQRGAYSGGNGLQQLGNSVLLCSYVDETMIGL
jgi:hypothetical protein